MKRGPLSPDVIISPAQPTEAVALQLSREWAQQEHSRAARAVGSEAVETLAQVEHAWAQHRSDAQRVLVRHNAAVAYWRGVNAGVMCTLGVIVMVAAVIRIGLEISAP